MIHQNKANSVHQTANQMNIQMLKKIPLQTATHTILRQLKSVHQTVKQTIIHQNKTKLVNQILNQII